MNTNITLPLMLGIALLAAAVIIAKSNTTSPIPTAGKSLTVAGESMSPLLHSGDQVRLIEKPKAGYQIGNLVAIKLKTREHKLLKRIIALPGDHVERRNERVFINGEPLQMSGWPANRRVPDHGWKILSIQLGRYNQIVPDNSLIVMGDNINNSYDSGDFGLLSMSQIEGKIEY